MLVRWWYEGLANRARCTEILGVTIEELHVLSSLRGYAGTPAQKSIAHILKPTPLRCKLGPIGKTVLGAKREIADGCLQ